MTLQQLEYVLAVYKLKHFAKAADYCQVTQPTLSSMIQKLEDELEMKIFDRRRQPIQPTPGGRAVIERARQVLSAANELKDTAYEERHSLEGKFVVAVLPTIAPYLIPRFFPQMMNAHPNMDVRIVEMTTAQMKRALDEGYADAGILARVDDMGNLQTQTLYYEQFFAYVSKNDPLFTKETIKTTDLTNEFLWLLDEGHCFRDQLVKFCHLKAAANSKKAYSLGSIETFMRIVEHNKGVTFIPELALPQLSDDQRALVRQFAMPIPTREIVMATPPAFVRCGLRDFLVKLIKQSVPAQMLQPSAMARVIF